MFNLSITGIHDIVRVLFLKIKRNTFPEFNKIEGNIHMEIYWTDGLRPPEKKHFQIPINFILALSSKNLYQIAS